MDNLQPPVVKPTASSLSPKTANNETTSSSLSPQTANNETVYPTLSGGYEHPFTIALANRQGGSPTFELPLPYEISYRGFLLRIGWHFGTTPSIPAKTYDLEAEWLRRICLMTKDEQYSPRIRAVLLMVQRYFQFDFDNNPEFMYRVPEDPNGKHYILGESGIREFLNRAKAGVLPEGYIIRVSVPNSTLPLRSPPQHLPFSVSVRGANKQQLTQSSCSQHIEYRYVQIMTMIKMLEIEEEAARKARWLEDFDLAEAREKEAREKEAREKEAREKAVAEVAAEERGKRAYYIWLRGGGLKVALGPRGC